jgi:hypothetical protein
MPHEGGGAGLAQVAEMGVVPAHHVECLGLPRWVADGLVQVEGAGGMAQCLAVVLLLFPYTRETVAAVGLAGEIGSASRSLRNA